MLAAASYCQHHHVAEMQPRYSQHAGTASAAQDLASMASIAASELAAQAAVAAAVVKASSHDAASSQPKVKKNICEGCGKKQASFGLANQRKRRWCAGCATQHADAFDLINKVCEGCSFKRASFGLPLERKRRWCCQCAKIHEGAFDLSKNLRVLPDTARIIRPAVSGQTSVVWPLRKIPAVGADGARCDLGNKMCEACDAKHASFGFPAERKRRWCAACSKTYTGSRDLSKKMCEDCDEKRATFGLAAARKRRWCGDCASTHDGATDLAKTTCEQCKTQHASVALPPGRKRRWCVSCAYSMQNAAGGVNGVGGVNEVGLPEAKKQRLYASEIKRVNSVSNMLN